MEKIQDILRLKGKSADLIHTDKQMNNVPMLPRKILTEFLGWKPLS